MTTIPTPPIPGGDLLRPPRPSWWPWVVCIIGLDYFSSLAYVPSIAVQTVGGLAPLVMLGIVALTFVAVPIYGHIARRSPHGQGSIALFERLVPQWQGKLLALVLLGFAATDFIFTRTLSTSDAAVHVLQHPHPDWQTTLQLATGPGASMASFIPDPLWRNLALAVPVCLLGMAALWFAANRRSIPRWLMVTLTVAVLVGLLAIMRPQLAVTLVLLAIGYLIARPFFRRGFTGGVLLVAVPVVVVYLALTLLIIGSGVHYLATHPHLLEGWWNGLGGAWAEQRFSWSSGSSWMVVALVALSLSGFELSMVVLPMVRGKAGDDPAAPEGRIRNARKMLWTAAGVMAVCLVGSALVTSVLIPRDAFAAQGGARDRALAYLAHGGPLADGTSGPALNPWFGLGFGLVYDLATVSILVLAGISIVTSLQYLIRQYLYRYGIELRWANKGEFLLKVMAVMSAVVVVLFDASVNEQRGAYATSVVVLLASAAGAVAIERWCRQRGPWYRRLSWYPVVMSGLFLVAAAWIVAVRPHTILIAGPFMVTLIGFAVYSRFTRHRVARFPEFEFADEWSAFLWQTVRDYPFKYLVPHRPGLHTLIDKEKRVRTKHHLAEEEKLAFVEVVKGDPLDFDHRPLLQVVEEEGKVVFRISRCPSVAHAVAALGLELSRDGNPPEIHFGWSAENPITTNLNFLFAGDGNVAWVVHELVHNADPEAYPGPRPTVVIYG